MNKQILSNQREDFILKYKAASKTKLTREQLADYLGILPKSVLRRKQEIAKETGLILSELKSLPGVDASIDSIVEFESILHTMAQSILKIERVNNVDEKTKVTIETNKKYVITSAQNATPVFQPFLKSLQHYCDVNNAELVIIPYRYKNPTSIWNDNNKKEEWWHLSIQKYLIEYERKIGKHIRIMGNIKIQPTASNPLSGFDSVTGIDSAIFGHPNVELKVIPAAPEKFPKILVTTGSVTIPNYSDSKAGHKGAFHHKYSAIVVEIDDDELFHFRHITSDNKGHFYDLDKKYMQTAVIENQRALALVAGDIHAEVVDDNTVNALFTDEDSVASITNPENFIFHDIIDFGSRSHWTIRDTIGRFKKHLFNDNNNVEESLQKVADFLELVSREDTYNYIIASNHNEHINRWLNEADPSVDPENARFYHYLKYNQYKSVTNGDREFDPIQFWCGWPDQYTGLDSNILWKTKFLSRKQNLEIGGIELSLHGDAGPNGSRGNLNNLSRLGQRVIIGHSHTPGIMNGSVQVGTTSRTDLDYLKGPSSWLNSSAIVYPDGNVTLINIINGRWKI